MGEVRIAVEPRFLTCLAHYFWCASERYSPEYLRNVVIPKLSGIHEKVLRISCLSYGLIASGWYDRAYLSELGTIINNFVLDFEEFLDAGLSDEDKFSKLEACLYSFELRLAALEYEVMRDYIVRSLEDYLEVHRPVLGKDFSLMDLLCILRRIVGSCECEEIPLGDEESPLEGNSLGGF